MNEHKFNHTGRLAVATVRFLASVRTNLVIKLPGFVLSLLFELEENTDTTNRVPSYLLKGVLQALERYRTAGLAQVQVALSEQTELLVHFVIIQ